MPAKRDRLSEVIAQLLAADLMPPVKCVETVGGGIVLVTVVGRTEPDVRTRLAAAMGSTRWKLVEVPDELAAGAEYRRQRSHASD